jgi:hypothetical protein
VSWIKRRPFPSLFALALILRAACALVTEFNPIFPAYYYTDASLTHVNAAAALADLRAGRAPLITGTLGERLQTSITLAAYRIFGPRPLAAKLVNASLGALAVAALAWALAFAFPLRVAFAAGLLVALWPSHVFYTSQNLKESPANLLAYLALGTALAAGFDPSLTRRRAALLALGAAAALLGAGFYRSYVLIGLTASLLFALGVSFYSKPRARAGAFMTAAALLGTLALYSSASNAVLLSFDLPSPDGTAPDTRFIQSRLIPVNYDEFRPGTVNRPTSPEGISRFRRSRQAADRFWAKAQSGDSREIGTQIYPDVEFRSWGDVAAFLPKAAFTALFMPLPGLYPMDGKPGRWAAAGENVVLLALAVLAVLGFARGPKTSPRLGLLAFFATMSAGAAFLEFDLGSAGRHKLLYLPMLFPFAVEEALRLLGAKEPA